MYLTGNKVALREVRREDLDVFLQYRNIYEDTKNYRTWKPLTDINQEDYWLNIVNSDKHCVFTIVDNKLDVVGECRISYIDWQKGNGEVGILIGYKYRNKGYAHEALKLMTDFAFNRMRLHRLVSQTTSMNIKSIKLFKDLGFKEEGIMRDATFFDGKYQDIILMSLLPTD